MFIEKLVRSELVFVQFADVLNLNREATFRSFVPVRRINAIKPWKRDEFIFSLLVPDDVTVETWRSGVPVNLNREAVH